MKQYKPNNERGSALVMALLALMILAAVGMGMIYTANTETSVNNNYRNSQQAYFAARAGLEEVRDRIFRADTAITLPDPKPTAGKGLPGTKGGAFYILNGSSTDIKPWDPTNKYFDDEYCHEGGGALPGVKCASIPTDQNWYNNTNAKTLPSGDPLPYKWVRINVKTNQSAAPWIVNPNPTTSTDPNIDQTNNWSQACYDGTQEIELLKNPNVPQPTWKSSWNFGVSKSDMLAAFWFGHGSSGGGNNGGGNKNPPPSTCTSVAQGTTGTACGCGSPQMAKQPFRPGATNCIDAGLEPIYVLTSLAVTGNGTRRMMQQEISRVTTPWPPAALAFSGPVSSVSFGTSNNYKIDGKDTVNATPCGPDVPSAGATQDQMPVNGNGTNNNPTAFEQVVAAATTAPNPFIGADSGSGANQCPMTASDVRDATLPLGKSTNATSDIQQIYQNMLSIADYIGPANVTTPGTDANPKITIIQNPDGSPADCDKCADFSGAGVLIVTGNLATAGKTQFNGLVIVMGGKPSPWPTGETALMDGSSHIYGGLMVANTYGSGIKFSVNGGGTDGGIHFDSCRIQKAQNKKSFKILNTREVLY